jgi:hypothetical protein
MALSLKKVLKLVSLYIRLYTFIMKLNEVIKALELVSLHQNFDDVEVSDVYTSDLLSDVMGNAPDGCVLVTIQAHKNTLAVATLKDVPGIIICNNRPVPEDLLEAAIKERVGLFVTEKNQYKVSGLLFELLNG